jgi:hypothetical protein
MYIYFDQYIYKIFSLVKILSITKYFWCLEDWFLEIIAKEKIFEWFERLI